MSLPEKVKDVTQHEWLSYRERLAEAASQLALAMAWGAEVCATVDWLREGLARARHRASLAALARDDARDERDQARSEMDDARSACNVARSERDAARAQLAAVVAALQACCDGFDDISVPRSECRARNEHARRVLADTAQAAREHDERVRAEERERCDRKVAEWQAIAGNATEAANAAWKPFAEVALLLGYKRAASPDFGEVDIVPLRDHIADLLAFPSHSAAERRRMREVLRIEERERVVNVAADALSDDDAHRNGCPRRDREDEEVACTCDHHAWMRDKLLRALGSRS